MLDAGMGMSRRDILSVEKNYEIGNIVVFGMSHRDMIWVEKKSKHEFPRAVGTPYRQSIDLNRYRSS